MVYGIVAPTVPIVFEEKQIPEMYEGLIFAIYGLPMILFSPYVPALIKTYSSNSVQAWGVLFCGVCVCGIGAIEYMESPEKIIAYSLTLRLFQGTCQSMIQTACYAVAATDFKSNQDAVIGYLEVMLGLGLGMGPVLGSCLYAAFGFDVSYYIVGISMFCFAALITFAPRDSSRSSN